MTLFAKKGCSPGTDSELTYAVIINIVIAFAQ